MVVKIIDGFVRSMIVLFWIICIALFLSVPYYSFFSPQQSLAVLAWSGNFNRAYVEQFERETGIKVYLSYYSTNEELLVKVGATGGQEYDVIMPSDYAVKKLIDKNLLKKIDKSKLNFFEKLNPLLLGHDFDPYNDYSIPYEWEIYIVGINKALLDQSLVITSETVWNSIFNQHGMKNFVKNSPYKIIMVNDPVEMVLFASRYLFGDVEQLNDDQISKVKLLLQNQKKYVEAYADVRGGYFLSTGSVAFALAHSAEIWKAMKDNSNLDFIVPDTTFISIEHCVIPRGTNKEEYIYKFLNFFFTQDAYKFHYNEQYFCPARFDVIDMLDVSDRHKKIMRSSPEEFERYHFVKDIVSEQQRQEIWLAAKS